MGLRGRVERLEIEVHEAELRRWVDELAAEQGLDAESLLQGAKRNLARIQVLKREHPLPVIDGKVDIEPHLRILAEEEGLDPKKVLEEARRIAEWRYASGEEAPKSP